MLSSKRSNPLLVSAMALALVLFASGCQNYDQPEVRVTGGDGKNPRVDPNAKPNENYTPEEKTFFTDISTLPAYEAHLSPIFKKLNSPTWAASIGAKKWLFVPNDLNADDTRNMSVHFLDGENEALAIQTSYDIRVQKVLFESFSQEEQAEVLLTEILTSVFLYKNLNDTELCALVRTGRPAIACPFLKVVQKNADSVIEDEQEESQLNQQDSQGLEIQEAAVRKNKVSKENKKRPEPVNDPRFGKKEPLKVTDDHRIKLLAIFLKENAKDLTHKKVLSKMTELGFDTRIFQVQFPG